MTDVAVGAAGRAAGLGLGARVLVGAAVLGRARGEGHPGADARLAAQARDARRITRVVEREVAALALAAGRRIERAAEVVLTVEAVRVVGVVALLVERDLAVAADPGHEALGVLLGAGEALAALGGRLALVAGHLPRRLLARRLEQRPALREAVVLALGRRPARLSLLLSYDDC